MSLPKKVESIKQFLDGSRNITDLSVFWRRPRAWVGGELLNRSGYQPLRCAYQYLTHRPSLTGLVPEVADQAKSLVENGYLVIENLLPDEVFSQIREEFFHAIDPELEYWCTAAFVERRTRGRADVWPDGATVYGKHLTASTQNSIDTLFIA